MFIPTNLLWTCDTENSNSVWGKWKCYCSESHDCESGCLMFLLKSSRVVLYKLGGWRQCQNQWLWFKKNINSLSSGQWFGCWRTTKSLRSVDTALHFFSPQRCWGSASWRTLWPHRWCCSPCRAPAWRWCLRCPWHTSHSAGPSPRRTNTPATGRPGLPWPQSPGNEEEDISSAGRSYKSLEKLTSKIDTHKNGSKVRVLVDVHVA